MHSPWRNYPQSAPIHRWLPSKESNAIARKKLLVVKSGKKLNAAKVFKKVTTLSTAENIKEETLLSIKREDFFLKCTWSWYSITGISSVSFGPNCRLTAEYRIAMGIQSLRLQTHIPVIPTRPPESAPKEAPNRLFGSFQVKKNSIFNICVVISN